MHGARQPLPRGRRARDNVVERRVHASKVGLFSAFKGVPPLGALKSGRYAGL